MKVVKASARLMLVAETIPIPKRYPYQNDTHTKTIPIPKRNPYQNDTHTKTKSFHTSNARYWCHRALIAARSIQYCRFLLGCRAVSWMNEYLWLGSIEMITFAVNINSIRRSCYWNRKNRKPRYGIWNTVGIRYFWCLQHQPSTSEGSTNHQWMWLRYGRLSLVPT